MVGVMGLGIQSQVKAQRYLTEVFSQVTVTDDITYGQNVSILTGAPALQDLKLTMYQPTGDTETNRPLLIFLPTGDFLPKGVNQTPVGSRKDSLAVELCTRLAKRGYVVASISYRLGWNPVDPNQDGRTGTLLRAVYRAVQDGRTAVRYFRKDIATNSNSYGINPVRIGVVGEGSGGYVALAMATLDQATEIQLTKFYDFTANEPYVIPAILGDFNGIGGSPVLNNDNHVGYSSEIDVCVNIGGAMGDSSWIEAGDAEMISFHCVSDPYAPYGTGDVIVPTTGDFVVEVSGSQVVQDYANALGNNASFIVANINDVYTTQANTFNGGLEGLYPFLTTTVESAPWQWWDSSDPMNANGLATNPNMSKAKALLYIDTILGYMTPRLYESLTIDSLSVNTANQSINNTQIRVFPNPSNGSFWVSSSSNIESIEMYSMTGQVVQNVKNITTNVYELSNTNLNKGVYFIKVKTKSGLETKKITLQ